MADADRDAFAEGAVAEVVYLRALVLQRRRSLLSVTLPSDPTAIATLFGRLFGHGGADTILADLERRLRDATPVRPPTSE